MIPYVTVEEASFAQPHVVGDSLVRLLRHKVRLLSLLPQHSLPIPRLFSGSYPSGFRRTGSIRFWVVRPMIGIRSGLPLPTLSEMLPQLFVYFLIEDYTNYWVHRFFHSKWGYENIHRVHHEYTAPIGYAAPYAHWAEVLLLGIPTFMGPAIAPGHMITFWLWIALRQIEAIETHSGYDFPWSPTKYIPFYGGAEYHDYHHYVGGQSQSNFASVFTYCDYIYGTDKGYRFQKKLLEQIKESSKKSNRHNGGIKSD
ncbi:hypothetical protein YC2023_023997 [Brassica napus]